MSARNVLQNFQYPIFLPLPILCALWSTNLSILELFFHHLCVCVCVSVKHKFITPTIIGSIFYLVRHWNQHVVSNLALIEVTEKRCILAYCSCAFFFYLKYRMRNGDDITRSQWIYDVIHHGFCEKWRDSPRLLISLVMFSCFFCCNFVL